jgi:serine/threonine protein phosphatase PrpC
VRPRKKAPKQGGDQPTTPEPFPTHDSSQTPAVTASSLLAPANGPHLPADRPPPPMNAPVSPTPYAEAIATAPRFKSPQSRPPAAIRFADWPGRIEVGRPAEDSEAIRIDPLRFRQQPYRPDTVLDGWETPRFFVRAASVRGDSHRETGVPRQDDFAIGFHPATGSVVVAVADGVSEADHSANGATVACRYVIEAVLHQLSENEQLNWSQIVQGAAWAIVDACQRLEGLEQPDAQVALERYASTLLAACIQPDDADQIHVQGIGIGDSEIRLISGDQLVSWLGDEKSTDDGIANSATTCLPQIPAGLEPRTWILAKREVVLLATDGIWDPVGTGDNLVGQLILSQLSSGPPDRMQFGRIVDFSRETWDDDRTMVAVWPRWETSSPSGPLPSFPSSAGSFP